MENFNKDKLLNYIDNVNDVDLLKGFSSELSSYKNAIIKELSDEAIDLAAESASLSTPFTYIAFKAKQLESKISKIQKKQGEITQDLSQVTIAITRKINSIEKEIQSVVNQSIINNS